MGRRKKNSAVKREPKTVDEWKAEGNRLFVAKKYPEAVAAYSAGIEIDAAAKELWSNRAAAYLELADNKSFELALSDADSAIVLDTTWPKPYLRRATALLHLGRLEEADETLKAPTMEAAEASTPHIAKAMRSIRQLIKKKQEGDEAESKDESAAPETITIEGLVAKLKAVATATQENDAGTAAAGAETAVGTLEDGVAQLRVTLSTFQKALFNNTPAKHDALSAGAMAVLVSLLTDFAAHQGLVIDTLGALRRLCMGSAPAVATALPVGVVKSAVDSTAAHPDSVQVAEEVVQLLCVLCANHTGNAAALSAKHTDAVKAMYAAHKDASRKVAQQGMFLLHCLESGSEGNTLV